MFKHDPAVVTAALTGVEAALNQAIALAPEAQQKLRALAGTLIALDIKAPDVEVYICVDPSGAMTLASYREDPPNTRIRGPLDSFIGLAVADDPGAWLINSNIEILGDTTPLLELQRIITTMDVDWEAPIVDTLGDVVGHQLSQVLRGLFTWGREASGSLRRQLSEFILEEGRLSPPALELDDFYQNVHALSLRVDRLESRARRLAKRIAEQPK